MMALPDARPVFTPDERSFRPVSRLLGVGTDAEMPEGPGGRSDEGADDPVGWGGASPGGFVVGIVGDMPAVAFGNDTNGERFGLGDTWDPPGGARGTGTLAPSEGVARPSTPNAVVIVLALLALAGCFGNRGSGATARRRRAVVAG